VALRYQKLTVIVRIIIIIILILSAWGDSVFGKQFGKHSPMSSFKAHQGGGVQQRILPGTQGQGELHDDLHCQCNLFRDYFFHILCTNSVPGFPIQADLKLWAPDFFLDKIMRMQVLEVLSNIRAHLLEKKQYESSMRPSVSKE